MIHDIVTMLQCHPMYEYCSTEISVGRSKRVYYPRPSLSRVSWLTAGSWCFWATVFFAPSWNIMKIQILQFKWLEKQPDGFAMALTCCHKLCLIKFQNNWLHESSVSTSVIWCQGFERRVCRLASWLLASCFFYFIFLDISKCTAKSQQRCQPIKLFISNFPIFLEIFLRLRKKASSSTMVATWHSPRFFVCHQNKTFWAYYHKESMIYRYIDTDIVI